MAPTKAKGKKTKGVTLVSPAQRTNTAGNTKQVSATTVQGQHLMSGIDVGAPVQDNVCQKLDVLMKMMADLSGQMRDLSGLVEATEDC